MKKDSAEIKNKPSDETIVITDECGDSMWDVVLQQDVKAVLINASSLLNRIGVVQVSDTTEA